MHQSRKVLETKTIQCVILIKYCAYILQVLHPSTCIHNLILLLVCIQISDQGYVYSTNPW